METPKKNVPSKRGRKPKPPSVNDFCRVCGCSFKTYYGDFANNKVSTENIFNVPGRTGVSNRPLAFQLRDLGYTVVEGDGFSSRVCAKCGTKIRRTAETKLFLDTHLVQVNQQDSPERFKRMSTSPAYSEARKSARINSPSTTVEQNRIGPRDANVSARKRIRFGERTESSNISQDEIETIPDNVDMSTTTADEERDESTDQSENIEPAETCSMSRDNINNLLHINNVDFTSMKKDDKPRVKVIIPRGQNLSIRTPPDEISAALIRNVCQKKWKSAANCLFKIDDLKKEVQSLLTRTVSKEFSMYSKSTSVLKRSSSDEVSSFANSDIVEEAKIHTPVWFSCISGAFNAHKSEKEFNKAVNPLALVTAVAAKHNNHCMSAVSKRISTILLHSGAKSQDFTRLNHLGVSTSHKQAIRDQREMGKNFDRQVIEWKNDVEKKKHDLLEQQGVKESDIVKPPTTYRIVADNLDFSVQARVQTNKTKNKSIHWTHQYAIQDRVQFPLNPDDYDKQSGQKKIADLELSELLPDAAANIQLENDFVVLVSRIITKFLKAFHSFRDVVIHHIPHEYSKEMSRKSDVCGLGLEFFNTNVSGEMAQFLMTDQSKYVPKMESGDDKIVFESVFLDGDQLTEERARNVQWVFQDGDNAYDRLEGLEPTHADWHAKVNLYQVENKIFLKDESAAEIGTTRASINRSAKTNAGKGVKDYNAYRDFHDREIEAHVLCSFMTFAGLEDIEGSPSKLLIPVKWDDRVQKREWLSSVIRQFLAEFVFHNQIKDITDQVNTLERNLNQGFICRAPGCDKQYQSDAWRVRHETQKHGLQVQDSEGDARNSLGYYKCPSPDCSLVYKTKATLKSHLKKKHPDHKSPDTENKDGKPDDQKDSEDYKYNYHQSKMCFGLLLFDINDAIREGDGQRLVNLYKIALLFYKCYGHTKYSYTCLLFLAKITAILPVEKAKSLIANRFCNSHGKIGKNISLDLRLEQLNGILKSCLKVLGPNFSEESAQRVARSIGKVEKILIGVDKDTQQCREIKNRSKTDPTEAVVQIVKDLMNEKAFMYTPGRPGYPSFPKFSSNLLQKLDYRDLYRWMKEKLSEWSKIYEKL